MKANKFDRVMEEIDRALNAANTRERDSEFRKAWSSFVAYAERSRRRMPRVARADADDYVQEFLVAAVRAIGTHDPARGPLRPHVLFTAERDAGRTLLRKQGWTGRSLDRLPLEMLMSTPVAAPSDGEEGAAARAMDALMTRQVEKEHAPARLPDAVLNKLQAACQSDVENDVVQLVREHGVGGLRPNATALAPWYGWRDQRAAEVGVTTAFRRVVHRAANLTGGER